MGMLTPWAAVHVWGHRAYGKFSVLSAKLSCDTVALKNKVLFKTCIIFCIGKLQNKRDSLSMSCGPKVLSLCIENSAPGEQLLTEPCASEGDRRSRNLVPKSVI